MDARSGIKMSIVSGYGLPGLPIAPDEVVHHIRMFDTFVDLFRVPRVPCLWSKVRQSAAQRFDWRLSGLTIGTICPRSPMIFSRRFSSSSRYGMMT